MDFEKKPITPEEEVNEEQTVASAEQPEEIGDGTELFDSEESTIFSRNTQYEETKKTGSAKKRSLITLLCLVLSAVVVAAGVFCVIKFLPENTDETTQTYSVKVKTTKAKDVKLIEINNQYGNFKIEPIFEEEETESGSESYSSIDWKLLDVDMTLLSSSLVGTTADGILSIYASREMTDTSLDYGFDKSYITIKVTTAAEGSYDITVGNKAPDGTGYYLKVSGDEKVYLVTIGTVDKFDLCLEDFANAVIITAPSLDSDTPADDKKYFDDEGNIAYFDYIELSGPHYNNEKITIKSLWDNEMASHTVTTADGVRYGDTDTCNAMFGLLSDGLVAIDAYVLYPTADDIKTYKLDKPQLEVKLKSGSVTVGMKASMYDEENRYYAVMLEGRDAIYAVSADALSMLGAKKTDYFNDFVFLEYYNSFSDIKIETPEKTYNFKTTYDENAESNAFKVELDGKVLDSDLFTAYYEHIVTIAPTYEESYISGTPSYTATFTFTDTAKGTKKLELIKQTDRRYLVVVDGLKLGLVSSSIYDNLVEYVENIVNDKGIPAP